MQPKNIPDRDLLLKETSVLVVDDDPITLLAIQSLLRDKLKALHTATCGQEGLFTYALKRPDIVITDLSMPGMDGLTMAQSIRDIKPDVPVLLLTAFDDPALLRRAIALGVTDYLTKPLDDLTILLDILARAASTLHQRRELERQIQRNHLMLEASPSPAVLVDLESERIVANNPLAAELGYTIGQHCDGDLIPGPLLAELRQGGEKLIAATSSREICAHGRHWLLHWAPVGHEAILFTALDITQRVRVEHFRDDVERITRHDLKTPLSAFTGLPDLLLMDDNLTEQQRMFIELIRDSGIRMLSMINLSLDLFKMETGTYHLPTGKVDFTAVLRQALGTTAQMGKSRGVNIDVAPSLSEVASVLVRGDELLCLTMLENLLKNALEASPKGRQVQVRLTVGQAVEVALRNCGEVPHDIRTHFFAKYATSGKHGGTGLGAYSAQMVARAHGGEIILDTNEPGHTTVRVLLPAAL